MSSVIISYKDVPLQTVQDDALGISEYVDGLSDFILNCETPFTISIQGHWGSGKTSIMNMIADKIKGQVIPIPFNTWQYSQFSFDSELSISLLTKFIKELSDKSDKKNKYETIFNILKDISCKLIENKIGVNVKECIKNNQEELIYEKIENLIKEIKILVKERIKEEERINNDFKGKIVFFIDDLDRLAPEKAVELLEVLKNFLDIEGCVFVLAVDYEIVVQGIKNKYGGNVWDIKGRSFFDKMIQLSFNVPVEQFDTSSYIEEMLNKIDEKLSELKLSKYTDYYVEVLKDSIGINPRAIKMLFNKYVLLIDITDKRKKSKGTNKIDRINIQEIEMKLLFFILCMQTKYESINLYLLKKHKEINLDFLKSLLKDSNILIQDLSKLNINVDDEEKTIREKFPDFISKLLEIIGDDEKRVESFRKLLILSKITSSSKEEKTDIEDQKDRTIYIFNGKEYNKSRLPVYVVKQIIKNNPSITFEQLSDSFPKEILGTWKHFEFIVPVDKAEEIMEKSGQKRHHLKNEDLIDIAGEKYAITRCWQKDSIEKFIDIAKKKYNIVIKEK